MVQFENGTFVNNQKIDHADLNAGDNVAIGQTVLVYSTGRAEATAHAGDIKVPLLIGQGKNDPRVNEREAQQIVDAMKAKRIPVSYVLFPDEGHGFARPVNNIAFNAVTENFLAQCLGGRAEPIGDTLKDSTAQVKHGAEFARGLAGALTAR